MKKKRTKKGSKWYVVWLVEAMVRQTRLEEVSQSDRQAGGSAVVVAEDEKGLGRGGERDSHREERRRMK